MQIQLQRILVPTDFSGPAKQALQYAIAMADRFGSDVHLLHVIEQPVIPFPEASTSWTLPSTDQREQIGVAQQRLIEQIDPKWAADHSATQVVKVGFAVDEIVKYAKEEDIDLIVLGTHGHTGFAHLLLGSVAEKVVRIATCPVLTVHPKGHQFVADQVKTPVSASR
jgi:universal stress protein A